MNVQSVKDQTETKTERILTGFAAAPGIAIGEVYVYRHDSPVFRKFSIGQKYREREIVRLDLAIKATILQIKHLRTQMAQHAGESAARIFDTQLVILEDEEYAGEIRTFIERFGLNAEAIVEKTTERWVNDLSSLEGELFRQKAHDVRDVGLRIIRNLLGAQSGAIQKLNRPAILVADNLLPSDVIHLMNDKIQAVAADLGGAASHTAILTRALEVPAVVGLKELTRIVENDDRIIVNGNSGKVFLHPTPETVETYKSKHVRYQEYVSSLVNLEHLPAETTDGRKVFLRANIEVPQEARASAANGGEGVGLFRSEYLVLTTQKLPSEEEQFEDYKQVIKQCHPHVVTIRTFDLGGDKAFPDVPHPAEANPFLGWRAVRVSFDQPKMLHDQLRAILRASAFGKVRIMFPFISGISEVRQLKSHLEIVKSDLKGEGIEYDNEIETGIMIELPSAVLMADKLAEEVDFFSIGTNDLTQFSLAVDRGNERVSGYYRPLHPAIIRMIRLTTNVAHREGIEVAVCGELAANSLATMLLVGLGVDELSMSPVAIPGVKKLIRSMSYREATRFAKQALTLSTADDLRSYCREEMTHRFADLPIWFNG